jgi:argininosuccinate lyase
LAADLGFGAVSNNSLTLYPTAFRRRVPLLLRHDLDHLSRLAEDHPVPTPAFGFIELGDAHATGLA